MRYHRTNRSLKGFTLIEMMVSIALFSVVMAIVGTAYLNLVNLDRTARATSVVINNLNFAIDAMTRSIRTGTSYECNGNAAVPNCWPPSVPGTEIGFTNDQGALVSYALDTTNKQIGECTNTVTCTPATPTYQAITDSRVTVNTLNFYVQGVNVGGVNDGIQPEVLIVVNGTVSTDPTKPPVAFTIQTTSSERGVDLGT